MSEGPIYHSTYHHIRTYYHQAELNRPKEMAALAYYETLPKPKVDHIDGCASIRRPSDPNTGPARTQTLSMMEGGGGDALEDPTTEPQYNGRTINGLQDLRAVAAEMKSVHAKAVHPRHQQLYQDNDASDGILRWTTAAEAQSAADHMLEIHPELIPEAMRPNTCTNEHCQRSNREFRRHQAAKDVAGVPHVVSESQKKSGVAPEASANPKMVQEKEYMEEELLEAVPEARPTCEGYSSTSHTAGATINWGGSLMMEEENYEYVSMPDAQEAEEYDVKFVKAQGEREDKRW